MKWSLIVLPICLSSFTYKFQGVFRKFLRGSLKLRISTVVSFGIATSTTDFFFFFKSNVFDFLKANVFSSSYPAASDSFHKMWTFLHYVADWLQEMSSELQSYSVSCDCFAVFTQVPLQIYPWINFACSIKLTAFTDMAICSFYDILIVRSWCFPCHIYVLVDSRVFYFRKQLNGNRNNT